jgi:hypothetical protein
MARRHTVLVAGKGRRFCIIVLITKYCCIRYFPVPDDSEGVETHLDLVADPYSLTRKGYLDAGTGRVVLLIRTPEPDGYHSRVSRM